MRTENRNDKRIRLSVLAMAVFLAAFGTFSTDIHADESQSERSETTVLLLSDSGSTVSGFGAAVKENQVEITDGGSYTLSGSLSNGQIYVETDSSETVTLIFNDVSVVNASEAAVHIEKAKEVCIELAEGTENLIQSGQSMPQEKDENASGGALYTRDDLTISGSGSLTVNGFIKDGIHGNDSVAIEGGTITVEAANHAVKANDALNISGGDLNLISGADGLHSEGELTVDGGGITIDAGDDGIHADTVLTVNDGTIEIFDSYEGLEGNLIHINGGNISVTALDDGINAYGGQNNLGKGMYAPPGSTGTGSQEKTEDTDLEDPELIIEDGTIYINAGGDGIDSNGDLIINGGFVIIDGPDSSMNGALDSGAENGGVCLVNGGTVLAIGISAMAETFSSTSEQNSFLLTFNRCEPGTKIMIEDDSGKGIFSYASAKTFSSIVFSSPELEAEKEYTVTVGNNHFTFTQRAGTVMQGYQ